MRDQDRDGEGQKIDSQLPRHGNSTDQSPHKIHYNAKITAMKIAIGKVRQILVKALVKRKMLLVQARLVAEEYLEGELQGKLSHGLMAFPSLLLRESLNFPAPKVIRKTSAMIVYDAKATSAVVVVNQALPWLVKTAKKQGISLALIKNMTTWLRPGTAARMLADKGLIGIVVNNGGRPMVAAPGGHEPVIGTNPIGIGLPTGKDPVVADMATSVHAWGEVKKAELSGRDLPKEAFINSKGKPAIKAKDSFAALPLGGYKGFSLGLLIEILTGSFMGRAMGKVQMKGDYRTAGRGGVIIALAPQASESKFKQANSQLVKEIGVSLPGGRAWKNRTKNLKKGYLEISKDLLTTLQQ